MSGREPAEEAARVARIEAYLEQLAGQGQLSGAVLVARTGRPLLSRGYGRCNFEQDTPNTPATCFQLASITKQFTALALLILAERGELRLSDSLALHLPDCLPEWQPVTLHQLLTHSSGIPDLPFWPDHADPAGPGPLTSLYLRQLFAQRPLEAAPGTRFRYSNWGYMLLGAVIERRAGLPYATFLQRAIFEPAGMSASGYVDRRAVLPRRAASYTLERGMLRNASFMDQEDAYAAGALYSTIEDLLRWEHALDGELLVRQATLQRCFRPYVAVGDGSSYGYGWQIAERAGRRVHYHGGRIDGFRVLAERYPEQRAAIYVLANIDQIAPEPIAAALAELLFAPR